jgi:hypothetical protein
MGMNYRARRAGVLDYHLNWGGHTFVSRALDGLGADLARWSGDDGVTVYVPNDVCRQWSQLLSEGLREGRIRMAVVPRRHGVRRVPVVDGRLWRRGSLSEELEAIDATIGSSEPVTSQTPTVVLDGDMTGVLERFAAFLDQCGGCWQR